MPCICGEGWGGGGICVPMLSWVGLGWLLACLLPRSLAHVLASLLDCLSHLAACLVAWLLGCLVAWLLGCLVAWLLGCLVAWLLGCLVAWLGCLVAWLLGCLVAWLGCLAWLLGCLVAWLVGRKRPCGGRCAPLPASPEHPESSSDRPVRASSHALHARNDMLRRTSKPAQNSPQPRANQAECNQQFIQDLGQHSANPNCITHPEPTKTFHTKDLNPIPPRVFQMVGGKHEKAPRLAGPIHDCWKMSRCETLLTNWHAAAANVEQTCLNPSCTKRHHQPRGQTQVRCCFGSFHAACGVSYQVLDLCRSVWTGEGFHKAISPGKVGYPRKWARFRIGLNGNQKEATLFWRPLS